MVYSVAMASTADSRPAPSHRRIADNKAARLVVLTYRSIVRSAWFRWVFDDYNALMEWKIFGREDVMFREIRRLKNQVKSGCPQLESLNVDEEPFISRVIALRQRLMAMRFTVLVFVLIITIGYVFLIGWVRGTDVSSPLDSQFWVIVGASTATGLAIIWFAVRRIRFVGQDALLSQLFSLCVLVEKNPKMFDKPQFKRAVNRRIEACARKIEILPLTFGADGDPATRKALGTAAGEVATHFRSYKIWVVEGGQEKQKNLVTALVNSLRKIWDGKWYELPRIPYAPTGRASLTARAGWILLFIAGLGGLLAVAYYSTTGNLGTSVAGPLIPFLGIILTFSLTKLGVKITALKQVADVSAEITKIS